jgi:hypothetical protein
LTFIRAILDGVPNGLTALEDICNERDELSWEQILTFISEVRESDLPSCGFALGILESGALTRLGTFANRFLHNPALAEALYRAAVRTDSEDPVSLTNLARFLANRGEPADLRESKRLVQLAQTFADRRFHWWRDVFARLQEVKDQTITSTETPKSREVETLPRIIQYKSLRQVRQMYRRIAKLEDAQTRGYELEKLIYALADLSFGTGKTSYRFTRPLTDKIHQVDNYFEHRGEKYRCECKWTKKLVAYDDLLKFTDKIDVVGVSGLFVSMAGFDQGAIQKSKEVRREKAIILTDGDEIDFVMRGILHFDDLMTIKRLYFDLKSETYFHVKSTIEDG